MPKDGGFAFPHWDKVFDKTVTHNGMTLRDYFMVNAPAKEIEEMCPVTAKGCSEVIGVSAEEYRGDIHYPRVLAKLRAVWADAMIAERDK